MGSQWPLTLEPQFRNGASPPCRGRMGAQITGCSALGSSGPRCTDAHTGVFARRAGKGPHFEEDPRAPVIYQLLALVRRQPLCSSLLGSHPPKSVSGLLRALVSAHFPGPDKCSLGHRTSGFTLPSSSAPCGLKTPPLSARAPGNQLPTSLKLGLPGWQLEKEGREAYG